MNTIKTARFSKKSYKVFLAIVLFIIAFVVILFVGMCFVVFCFYIALKIAVITSNLIGYILAFGIAFTGFIVFCYLFKFLSSGYKVRRDDLVEINKISEPRLFQLIEETALEVECKLPKKVYLSPDVNAAVFFDATFLSLFFPVRKNLMIGLGLIHISSDQELKSVLAHEFGHFTQNDLFVGSYFYYVNKVLHSMIYEYYSFAEERSEEGGFLLNFGFFQDFALIVINKIKSLLIPFYELINKNYMALSRDLEFHADAIAAKVVGTEICKLSLQKNIFADSAFSNILLFYNSNVEKNIRSKNIFKDLNFLFHFQAKESNLEYKDSMPIVTLSVLDRFNRSKLIFNEQWDSHPSTKNRVEAIEKLNVIKPKAKEFPAIELLKNALELEERITDKLFSRGELLKDAIKIESKEFENEYLNLYYELNSKIFKTYFFYNKFEPFEIENIIEFQHSDTIESLFSNENVANVVENQTLELDKLALNDIAENNIKVKSFDYDGIRYKNTDAENVIKMIDIQIEQIKPKILENDIKIYKYFNSLALLNGQELELKNLYIDYFTQMKKVELRIELHTKMIEAANFITTDYSIKLIDQAFSDMKPIEVEFKKDIAEIVNFPNLNIVIDENIFKQFTGYLEKDYEYFDGKQYIQDELDFLMNAIQNYPYLYYEVCFAAKKNLINFMENLQIESDLNTKV